MSAYAAVMLDVAADTVVCYKIICSPSFAVKAADQHNQQS
jgi:hypothetical protein